MTDDRTDQQKLADNVTELVEPRTHEEPWTTRVDGTWRTQKHKTKVRPLLDQLAEAIEPGGTGEHGRGVPGSRPSARLEAIDVLLRIDLATALWVDHLGMNLRHDTPANLRALVGASGTLDPSQLRTLKKASRAWLTWARVTTGWDVPAWRPDNTCPLCAVRGGLRVRAGDGVTSTEAHAMCIECGEHWTPETIGLLAAHIRSENDDEQEASA